MIVVDNQIVHEVEKDRCDFDRNDRLSAKHHGGRRNADIDDEDGIEAQHSADVEVFEADTARILVLGQQQSCDQKAAEHEEDLQTDRAYPDKA
ncbi:hypothetical protein D3C87_1454120 [compost metagenome]